MNSIRVVKRKTSHGSRNSLGPKNEGGDVRVRVGSNNESKSSKGNNDRSDQQVEKEKEEENNEGTLFSGIGEVIMPDNKKKEKSEKRKTFIWGKKITKGLTGAFEDSGLGNLFDSME